MLAAEASLVDLFGNRRHCVPLSCGVSRRGIIIGCSDLRIRVGTGAPFAPP